jgi:hypothetical protein
MLHSRQKQAFFFATQKLRSMWLNQVPILRSAFGDRKVKRESDHPFPSSVSVYLQFYLYSPIHFYGSTLDRVLTMGGKFRLRYVIVVKRKTKLMYNLFLSITQ